MFGLDIFSGQGIGESVGIKSLALVLYDKRHSASQLASTTNLNELASIEMIAMEDRVIQCFPHRQLHTELSAGNTPRRLDDPDQPVNQRRDRFDPAGNRSLYF